MASKSSIVIFLDRTGFLLYQTGIPNIWQFSFEEGLVSDLEVVDKDGLINVIWSFIQSNKIVPGDIIVVLSDSVVFEKDLTSQKSGQEGDNKTAQADYSIKEMQEKEIQRFMENVPFEEVIAKVIGGKVIVATNKELLEAIIYPFKKLGCILEAVVPSFIYAQKTDFSQGLSQDIAQMVIRETNLLRFGNMLLGQQEAVQQPKEENDYKPAEYPINKTKNPRQYVLLAVFIILLGVLAVVYFTLGRTSE